MKALLFEALHCAAFLVLFVSLFFLFIAFEDGDLVALKAHLATLLLP